MDTLWFTCLEPSLWRVSFELKDSSALACSNLLRMTPLRQMRFLTQMSRSTSCSLPVRPTASRTGRRAYRKSSKVRVELCLQSPWPSGAQRALQPPSLGLTATWIMSKLSRALEKTRITKPAACSNVGSQCLSKGLFTRFSNVNDTSVHILDSTKLFKIQQFQLSCVSELGGTPWQSDFIQCQHQVFW